ncbi:hypothetical protein D1007_62217 [Hordeum vulgare]|nr:hypothetical protein D1007_62217 [Hordeum vulgare]
MPRKGGKCGGSWRPTVPAEPWPVLQHSTVVKKVQLVVAVNLMSGGHPNLAKLMASEEEGVPAVPLHFHDLISGVLPPFSGFINVVLSDNHIHALHLDPHSLVLLSAFTFLCEPFVGVTPSMALLCHFFSLELTFEVQCSGCASWRTVDATALGVLYAELFPEPEGFQRKWVQVEAVEAGALFQPSPTPATPNRGWSARSLVTHGSRRS